MKAAADLGRAEAAAADAKHLLAAIQTEYTSLQQQLVQLNEGVARAQAAGQEAENKRVASETVLIPGSILGPEPCLLQNS